MDKWPPPKWAWIAAAVMTLLSSLLLLLGAFGAIVFGIVVAVCLILGTNARLKNLGAEDFWKSCPRD